MPPFLRNPILRMVLIFGLCYGSFLILGQVAGLSQAYRNGIRTLCTNVFQDNWSEGILLFRELGDQTGKGLETAIDMINRQQNNEALAAGTAVKSVKVFFSIHTWGYLLGSFLISLIIASPVSIKRKLWSMGISLLIFHLYFFFRIWLKLVWEMDHHPDLGITSLSDFWSSVSDGMNVVFVQNIVVSFLCVTIIWVLVTFRREDWGTFSRMINRVERA